MQFGAAPPVVYLSQPVTRGDLVMTVSATGTLAPRDQVDVGAEVSGRIDAGAGRFQRSREEGREARPHQHAEFRGGAGAIAGRAGAGAGDAGAGGAGADPHRGAAALGRRVAPGDRFGQCRSAARPGRRAAGGGAGQFQSDDAGQGDDLFADRRRGAGPQGLRRPDRGRGDDDAGAVHAGQRPVADGARRRHRRGRCRAAARRHQGHLHRRCLSDAALRGQAGLDPQRAQDGAGRRHLSGRAPGGEPRGPAQAGHDRDRRARRRRHQGRRPGRQHGAALRAARRGQERRPAAAGAAGRNRLGPGLDQGRRHHRAARRPSRRQQRPQHRRPRRQPQTRRCRRHRNPGTSVAEQALIALRVRNQGLRHRRGAGRGARRHRSRHRRRRVSSR